MTVTKFRFSMTVDVFPFLYIIPYISKLNLLFSKLLLHCLFQMQNYVWRWEEKIIHFGDSSHRIHFLRYRRVEYCTAGQKNITFVSNWSTSIKSMIIHCSLYLFSRSTYFFPARFYKCNVILHFFYKSNDGR